MAEAGLKPDWRLDPQSARALALGTHDNPFAMLGPHETRDGHIIRAFLPGATKVDILRRSDGVILATLDAANEAGLFEGLVHERVPYRLRIAWADAVQETEDPYSFGLLLGDLDLHLFNEGRHFELVRCLGAQSVAIDGVNGVRFAVWRRTPVGSPSSAISIPGTAAGIPCAYATAPESGSCSFPAWRQDRTTSTTSSVRVVLRWRGRLTP